MKFSRLAQLQNFIKEKNIFPDFEGMYEIYTGGSSYNFCVQTKSGKYFLKLVKNVKTFNKIKELWHLFYGLNETKTEIFEDYGILIMPYYEGHKISYKDCSPQFLQRLFEKYQALDTCQVDTDLILLMRQVSQLCADIEMLLNTQSSLIGRFIYTQIWKRIEKDLISLPPVHTLIHGDFTANNILITAGNNPIILDWEQIRHGYGTEDWAGFALELTGFRGLWGNLAHFQNLFSLLKEQMAFSAQEWLYGVQIFYLALINRRLANHKKQSWRKRICLGLIMLGYFRIRKLLRKNIA